MALILNRMYAIADRETLDTRGLDVGGFCEELRDAGVRLLQYRDKTNKPQEILRTARSIADVFAGKRATLILNDRADLAALLRWGVHLGQHDLPIAAARQIVGNAIIGLSTHTDDQVRAAEETSADYIAVGPVFATSTKADAEPTVGVKGVQRARALTAKPVVAIGGITTQNAGSVWAAGADSVAVISALLPRNSGESVLEVVRAFSVSQ